MKYVIF